MPLIPRKVATKQIHVDGDTYTIKTALTFFEREQTDNSNVMKIQMPFGKVERQDMRPEDMVDVVMDIATHKLRKLKIWLVEWTHTDKLNSENLRRLPPHHADLILANIEELEELQAGAMDDTPLEIFLDVSSET